MYIGMMKYLNLSQRVLYIYIYIYIDYVIVCYFLCTLVGAQTYTYINTGSPSHMITT